MGADASIPEVETRFRQVDADYRKFSTDTAAGEWISNDAVNIPQAEASQASARRERLTLKGVRGVDASSHQKLAWR